MNFILFHFSSCLYASLIYRHTQNAAHNVNIIDKTAIADATALPS